MSSRALQNQHRQASWLRLKSWSRICLVGVAIGLSFLTLSLLVLDRLHQPDRFLIEQLKIAGHFENVKPEAIESIVRQHPLGNFFSVNLDEIKQRIEQLDWISNAEVRREWPDSLLIKVSEHQPVMIWNKRAWLTDKGEVVDLPQKALADHYIRLSGPRAQASSMLAMTQTWRQQFSLLDIQLIALSVSNSGAISLHLRDAKNRFRLQLGSHNTQRRLNRFLTLYHGRFYRSSKTLTRADARYPDGLAIVEGAEIDPLVSLEFDSSGELL